MYQNQAMPSMPQIVKVLRVVADPNRLRILLLLDGEELSVAELQEILVMGQSTISTHLSQLKQAARRRVVKKRQDKMRAFFDSVAGRLGRNYVPGKSWKSLAEALLRLMPPVTVADLGAGEGSFALLLSQRAVRVIAVDTSARMIEVGREEAQRNGVKNIDYRLGDMEEIPIANAEVDVVFFSQSLHHALH